jgi:hypothetical protein
MARDLPIAVATAIAAKVVSYAFLAEFAFASGTLRMWTGLGDKTWDGHTWSGAGDFAQITPIDETTEIGAAGMNFTLSGIPSSLISISLNDAYRNKPCKLWLAILDDDEAIVATYRCFGGRMDVMNIEDAGETATITVQAENRLIDLTRPRILRYSDADQQRLHPGDTGLRYAASLAEKPLPWGIPASNAASAPAYSGGGSAGDQTELN